MNEIYGYHYQSTFYTVKFLTYYITFLHKYIRCVFNPITLMNQSFKMNRFSLTTFLKKKKGQNVSSKNYRYRLFIHFFFFLTNCHLPYEQPLNLRAQALYQKSTDSMSATMINYNKKASIPESVRIQKPVLLLCHSLKNPFWPNVIKS